VKATESGRSPVCRVDGRPIEPAAGQWLIPHSSDDVAVEIERPPSA